MMSAPTFLVHPIDSVYKQTSQNEAISLSLHMVLGLKEENDTNDTRTALLTDLIN